MSADFLEKLADKNRPRLQAVIREAECIGCVKCIKACPVDAILGSAKQMHTVIAKDCTGCELCVEPCPVDCIDMVSVAEPMSDEFRDRALNRFNLREKRLQVEPVKKIQLDRKAYILAAIKRAKAKKA